MNGERGSRGCNPLERGFQRGCKSLWSRAGSMPRLRGAPARSVEDAKGGALLVEDPGLLDGLWEKITENQ